MGFSGMKPVNFDCPVSFYATAAMVQRAREKADREGRTFSEVMRQALRRELEAT